MKKIIWFLALSVSMFQVQAQRTVTVGGQIDNLDTEESIYLGIDSYIVPVALSGEGAFSVEANIQQSPSYFYFANISKRGKINRQTPRIWFDKDKVSIHLDWSEKSFTMEGLMSFQSTSEKIESLNGKEQIEFILNEPNSIPSLFFADQLKESFALADLEKLTQHIADEYKETVQLKRIENYVLAKKKKPVKKGNTIEGFSLPNSEGREVAINTSDNKPKLITVFSSGCSYSIASISLLEQLAQMNNDHLEIITIWQDPSESSFLNAHAEEKKKITWTNLWDEYGYGATYLNNDMWPTFYAINAEGILTDKFNGYNKKTAKKLKQLLE